MNKQLDTQAEFLISNRENIEICSKKIIDGDVVIFPTETVYGIGANAFDLNAIDKIYKYKNRPITNPLIMHIISWKGSEIYTNLNKLELNIVNLITNKFWPGPLTILLKKSSYVSDKITANSKWVALRSPSNKVARNLLSKCMVPIVAPSANISGKITSTCKQHIIEHFKDCNISVLYEDRPSEIGTESTIIKIDNDEITMLRPGIITLENIKNILDKVDYKNIKYTNFVTDKQEDHPGSSIKHYSPDIPTFLFNFINFNDSLLPGADEKINESIKKSTKYFLENCACVDFNKTHFNYRDKFGAYVDLSEDNDVKEAIFNLYNVLHQLNNISSINRILITNHISNKEGLFNTLYDRIYRASSGKILSVPIEFI